mgnify:CR=1 FL=1
MQFKAPYPAVHDAANEGLMPGELSSDLELKTQVLTWDFCLENKINFSMATDGKVATFSEGSWKDSPDRVLEMIDILAREGYRVKHDIFI